MYKNFGKAITCTTYLWCCALFYRCVPGMEGLEDTIEGMCSMTCYSVVPTCSVPPKLGNRGTCKYHIYAKLITPCACARGKVIGSIIVVVVVVVSTKIAKSQKVGA